MSGDVPKIARVRVIVELADGGSRQLEAIAPDEVNLVAWSDPVDLIADAYPNGRAPSGASVSIAGGTISTTYVDAPA